MTNKKLAIGTFLTASLVALGIGQSKLQEPTIAASNDVMAPAFWSTHCGPSRFPIIGSPVTPLAWMWMIEITFLRCTETLENMFGGRTEIGLALGSQNAAHPHRRSLSMTLKAI